MSTNDGKQWFEKDDNNKSVKRAQSSSVHKPSDGVPAKGSHPQKNPNGNGRNYDNINRKKSGKKRHGQHSKSSNANNPAPQRGSVPQRGASGAGNKSGVNGTANGNGQKGNAGTRKRSTNVERGVEKQQRGAGASANHSSLAAAAATSNNNVTKPEAAESTKDADLRAKKNKRTRTRTLRQSILTAALCLLALTILIFIVHHLADYIAVKPEFEFISKGSVEHTIGARALIVRDEDVIPSATAGDLVTQVAEGSRVAKDQHIAMVVPSDLATVVDSLRNTQSQISEVQQELISGGQTTGADAIYQSINGSIGPIVDMMRLDAMNGNISDMSSYASSISVLISQRETELASLEFDDERLRVLRSDEAGYESQLRRRANVVNAVCPGIVSFKLDGLETELSFSLMLEAEPDVIRNYINSSTGLITSDLVIDNDENLARIARNEEQYMAVFLDERTATPEAFAEGSLHTINVGSEGISIGKCVVKRVVSTNRGLLVVFSTTRYVEDLLDLRTVDIEVVINETDGLRVPIGSLVNPDYERGVATIYVNNQGFADELGVLINDYDREFAIISPIGDSSRPNTQTVIITNPSSVKPGQKVD